MLKVGLIRVYYSGDVYQNSMPPLGLGYLVSYAKQKVSGIDYRYCPDLAAILDYKPDLLAVSSATESFTEATRLAETVKAELGIPIFVGGMHITAIPHTLPRAFDVGAINEGELIFADLLELYKTVRRPTHDDLRKVDGIAFHAGDTVETTKRRQVIPDLDLLPWPDRDVLGEGWTVPFWRQVHMVSSRGCPYDCSFCSSGRTWSKLRFFSVDYTVKEIEALCERYHPLEIYFFDDLMISNRKRFIELCEALMARGLHKDLSFRAFARSNLITDELADAFAACNFRYIDFGIESNVKHVLEYLGKHGVTPEINQQALDKMRARQLSVGVNLILGSRVESREDALESLAFIERNRDVVHRVGAGLLTLLPGTAVWEEGLARGVIGEEMDWGVLGFNSLPTAKKDIRNFPLMLDRMTPQELWEVYLVAVQLMKEINGNSEAIYWRDQFFARADRVAGLERDLEAARRELQTLKGSSLVRGAMRVRDLLGRAAVVS